jgi:hypothetical protein
MSVGQETSGRIRSSMEAIPLSSRVEGNSPLEDGHLTLVDVARHLNMSLVTVGRWAGSGRIHSAIAPEGSWWFRVEDVDSVAVLRTTTGEITSAE